jgi:uncharacterized membrane protein HdeD (DUF308 family)
MPEPARPGEASASAALVFGVSAAIAGILGAVDVFAMELRFLAVPAVVSGALGVLAVVSGIVAVARRTPDRVKTGVAVVLGLLASGVAWAAVVRAIDTL